MKEKMNPLLSHLLLCPTQLPMLSLRLLRSLLPRAAAITPHVHLPNPPRAAISFTRSLSYQPRGPTLVNYARARKLTSPLSHNEDEEEEEEEGGISPAKPKKELTSAKSASVADPDKVPGSTSLCSPHTCQIQKWVACSNLF